MKPKILGLFFILSFCILYAYNPNRVKSDTTKVIKGSIIEIAQPVIDPNKKMVAITYDDGPHEIYTPQILDILEEYEARATFFMIGNRIEHHIETVKRMVLLGCELGNHTYGHKDISRMSDEAMKEQLDISVKVLSQFLDEEFLPKVLRPPFGNTDQHLKEICDYPMVNWSIDTKDWSLQNVKYSVNEVLSQVQDGDVILLHDMYETTVEITAIIVKELTEQGYQLVTVSEMFEAKQIQLENGKVYRHAH